ncbi:MAG: hypothetical protein ACOX3K_05825 [Bacilli bacterium]|jgi:hypothetical protein
MRKTLFTLTFLSSFFITSCGGNFPYQIQREFSVDDVAFIEAFFYGGKHPDYQGVEKEYHFDQKEVVAKVYQEFSREYVKEKTRNRYRTNREDCLYIWVINFGLMSNDHYEIQYYVYSHTDGTVVYPDGAAHAFYGNAKNKTFNQRIDDYFQEQGMD